MAREGRLFGLLIGVDHYESERLRDLAFAVADATAMAGLLCDRFGARDECLVLLRGRAGDPLRRAEFLKGIDRFTKAPMSEGDTFVFYYSGHGFAYGDRAYLLASNSEPGSENLLRDTGISLESLRSYLSDIGAGRQVVFLDACRNEPTRGGKGAGEGSLGVVMAKDVAALAQAPASGPTLLQSRAIISSCWHGQVAYEYRDGGHSWFFHNFLEEVERFEGEEIDLAELVDAVWKRMQEEAWRCLPDAARQSPHFILEGRPIRLRLRTGAAEEAPPSPSGEIKIVRQLGEIEAGGTFPMECEVRNTGRTGQAFGVAAEIIEEGRVVEGLGQRRTRDLHPGERDFLSFSYAVPAKMSGTFQARVTLWADWPGESARLGEDRQDVSVLAPSAKKVSSKVPSGKPAAEPAGRTRADTRDKAEERRKLRERRREHRKARRKAAEKAFAIAKALDEDPDTAPKHRRRIWEDYLREFWDTGVGVEFARARLSRPKLFRPAGPEDARRAQEQAARASGLPLEQEIDLGGGVKLALVFIPAGEFKMGSPEDEKERDEDETLHDAKIERPFWIGKFEVRQVEWKAVMGKNPSFFAGGRNPVDSVSWRDVLPFLEKLSGLARGGRFRLPTEAEWEYACRAGSTTRFFFGDDPKGEEVGRYAWCSVNFEGDTNPVGMKRPNPWGLYDMHGNVWEWCRSLYRPYPYDAGDGREDLEAEGDRVLRGGSCSSSMRKCRSAVRERGGPESRGRYVGLRVVREIS